MSGQRTHYVTTTDGVTIGGTVDGQGPPLVFVHGTMADGDIDWQALVPHLTGRFACYLPSWRGRGLSDDHPDLSPGRMVDDLLAYVDSIGEPTGLVGWSLGASLAFAVAVQSDAVIAVAPFELGVLSVMDEQTRTAFGDTSPCTDTAQRPRGHRRRPCQIPVAPSGTAHGCESAEGRRVAHPCHGPHPNCSTRRERSAMPPT